MKKLLFTLVTLLLLLLILAGGAELVLRSIGWAPSKDRWDYSHPFIRRKVRANADMPYRADPITGYQGEFRFQGGPIGYRTRTVTTREKPERAYRIFFLGESTTACSYLPHELTFAQKVEDALNANATGEQRYECANAGVDGSGASDSLAMFLHDVVFANPDCVVVMHAVNDLVAGLYPKYVPDGSDPRSAKAKARNTYLEWFGDSRPLIYHFYKSLRPQQSERFTLGHIRKEREAFADFPEQEITDFPNVRHYSRVLQTLVGACRAAGVRPVLMTEPSLYQENLSEEAKARLWCGFQPREGINPSVLSLMRGMNVYCEAVRSLGSELGVEVIDLEREIPKSLEFLFDDVHFTVKGCERASAVIAPRLKAGRPSE
ncbi:MAG: hypothetical protein HUU16_05165 [Candidatus Omnitrophica bacterium]|nr:hypothetical protein [bacterium]NUN95542.1 hypothetical protein [Candidatus Omnitrophota bacterium]